MKLKEKDKIMARNLLTRKLNTLSSNQMIRLPKSLLEDLILDYYEVKRNNKTLFMVRIFALEKELLDKLDLSEINLDDVLTQSDIKSPFNKKISINLIPRTEEEQEYISSAYDDYILEIGGIICNNHPITKRKNNKLTRTI